MEVYQFQPQSTVIAQMWDGGTYDLTGELYSWTRQKGFPNGTFQLDFVRRTNANGQTWADILKPMTYIEIRASNVGKTVNGKLPIILRGFVDGPIKSLQMGQSGVNEPGVALSGQDFTAILNKWQILYLFTQNTFQQGGNLNQIAAQASGFGLFANFNIPIFSNSINEYMQALFKNILDPTLKALGQHNFPSLPTLLNDFTYPQYPINGFTIASYTGSYYNLLQYVSSPPFGEMFVLDKEDAPYLIGRMTPYKKIDGTIPAPGVNIGNAGVIHPITAINVQQTDQDLYTYFLTWAADAQIVGPATMPTFMPGLSNGVMTAKSTLYGIMPFQISTPWVSLATSNGTGSSDGALQLASTLNQWAIDVLGDNEQFWSGTVACHGDESYQIGTYRTVPETNQEFYITSISDTYNYNGNTWTCDLSVARGRDL